MENLLLPVQEEELTRKTTLHEFVYSLDGLFTGSFPYWKRNVPARLADSASQGKSIVFPQ